MRTSPEFIPVISGLVFFLNGIFMYVIVLSVVMLVVGFSYIPSLGWSGKLLPMFMESADRMQDFLYFKTFGERPHD
jgi:hypothetical protein